MLEGTTRRATKCTTRLARTKFAPTRQAATKLAAAKVADVGLASRATVPVKATWLWSRDAFPCSRRTR